MAGILIIDDEDDYRFLLMDMLGDAGHSVHACGDGEEALAFLAEHLPDLIISDWIMPRLDGLELIRTLRSAPKLAHCPVMLLSVKRSREDELEALHAGADAFLSKPIVPDELVARVGALLRQGAPPGTQSSRIRPARPVVNSAAAAHRVA